MANSGETLWEQGDLILISLFKRKEHRCDIRPALGAWLRRYFGVRRNSIGRVRSCVRPVDAATSRFTPGKLPKDEPLNQLVEFSFDSPRGEKTVATMNPGLSYVAVSWQLAAEAIVPLNSKAGHSIGARAQLLLFLDELIPSLFGKPLLSDK